MCECYCIRQQNMESVRPRERTDERMCVSECRVRSVGLDVCMLSYCQRNRGKKHRKRVRCQKNTDRRNRTYNLLYCIEKIRRLMFYFRIMCTSDLLKTFKSLKHIFVSHMKASLMNE